MSKQYTGSDVIRESEIFSALEKGKTIVQDSAKVKELLEKAKTAKGLTFEEAAVLIQVEDPALLADMAQIAKKVKEDIYGKRVVLFAPLYVGNYCVINASIAATRSATKNLPVAN